jgi:hypothetical protein
LPFLIIISHLTTALSRITHCICCRPYDYPLVIMTGARELGKSGATSAPRTHRTGARGLPPARQATESAGRRAIGETAHTRGNTLRQGTKRATEAVFRAGSGPCATTAAVCERGRWWCKPGMARSGGSGSGCVRGQVTQGEHLYKPIAAVGFALVSSYRRVMFRCCSRPHCACKRTRGLCSHLLLGMSICRKQTPPATVPAAKIAAVMIAPIRTRIRTPAAAAPRTATWIPSTTPTTTTTITVTERSAAREGG